jgi:hypothetical protein
MTVPVSTWVSVSSDGSEEFREMCFFIGEEFQENPPKPTNELVFIKERPTMTIFTRLIFRLILVICPFTKRRRRDKNSMSTMTIFTPLISGCCPVAESQTEVGLIKIG